MDSPPCWTPPRRVRPRLRSPVLGEAQPTAPGDPLCWLAGAVRTLGNRVKTLEQMASLSGCAAPPTPPASTAENIGKVEELLEGLEAKCKALETYTATLEKTLAGQTELLEERVYSIAQLECEKHLGPFENQLTELLRNEDLKTEFQNLPAHLNTLDYELHRLDKYVQVVKRDLAVLDSNINIAMSVSPTSAAEVAKTNVVSKLKDKRTDFLAPPRVRIGQEQVVRQLKHLKYNPHGQRTLTQLWALCVKSELGQTGDVSEQDAADLADLIPGKATNDLEKALSCVCQLYQVHWKSL